MTMGSKLKLPDTPEARAQRIRLLIEALQAGRARPEDADAIFQKETNRDLFRRAVQEDCATSAVKLFDAVSRGSFVYEAKSTNDGSIVRVEATERWGMEEEVWGLRADFREEHVARHRLLSTCWLIVALRCMFEDTWLRSLD